jgi:hypothetical protein
MLYDFACREDKGREALFLKENTGWFERQHELEIIPQERFKKNVDFE